jgi:hypothetical protein
VIVLQNLKSTISLKNGSWLWMRFEIFGRINATQWQHTLAQRHRLGESEKQNC